MYSSGLGFHLTFCPALFLGRLHEAIIKNGNMMQSLCRNFSKKSTAIRLTWQMLFFSHP